jgi:hypothetical protein
MSEKMGLSSFANRTVRFSQQNFSSIFSPLVSVDLKNICNV